MSHICGGMRALLTAAGYQLQSVTSLALLPIGFSKLMQEQGALALASPAASRGTAMTWYWVTTQTPSALVLCALKLLSQADWQILFQRPADTSAATSSLIQRVRMKL